jgi:quercetin dioxygenase-like cupin family protein
MRRYTPWRATLEAVSARPDRPASAILHDSPDARLVVFRIAAGQEIPAHRSPSTVLLTVLEGRGVFTGSDGERAVRTGDLVAYEPEELHGMRAVDETLAVLATITPGPGSREPGRPVAASR